MRNSILAVTAALAALTGWSVQSAEACGGRPADGRGAVRGSGGCCGKACHVAAQPADCCTDPAHHEHPAKATEETTPYAANAADKKNVTLEGTILCAKCALKETKKCTTAIVVKEGGKDVTYYLIDKGTGEEYHEAVCGGDKHAGKVVGVVSEKDGKKYVTPSKVEYAKK